MKCSGSVANKGGVSVGREDRNISSCYQCSCGTGWNDVCRDCSNEKGRGKEEEEEREEEQKDGHRKKEKGEHAATTVIMASLREADIEVKGRQNVVCMYQENKIKLM